MYRLLIKSSMLCWKLFPLLEPGWNICFCTKKMLFLWIDEKRTRDYSTFGTKKKIITNRLTRFQNLNKCKDIQNKVKVSSFFLFLNCFNISKKNTSICHSWLQTMTIVSIIKSYIIFKKHNKITIDALTNGDIFFWSNNKHHRTTPLLNIVVRWIWHNAILTDSTTYNDIPTNMYYKNLLVSYRSTLFLYF